MAINVSRIEAPAPVEGAITNAQTAAKARAIAAFNKSAAAQDTPPVQDPTQVTPEEMSVVKPTGQDSTVEPPAVDESEAVKAETPAKAPEEQTLSAQYAQLARKEKALRTQAMQVKQQADAMAAREAAVQAKEAELKGNPNFIPKERLTADTLKVLEEAGIDYDQITQMALNAPSPEARQQAQVIAKLEAKLAALEEGQKKAVTTFEENQKNQYNQAVNQITSEVRSLDKSDSAYEIIKETNSEAEVVDLITKTFKEDGVLLTVEEAAKAVEEHLYEEAFKLTKLSKIQKRLAEKAVATPPSTTSSKQADDSGKKPAMKTLTNSVGSSRPLSAKERAVLAFKGELKS